MTEIIIDESNFEEYFFDVRRHQPKHGQVVARFTSMADFVKGNEKQNVLDLLYKKGKIEPCTQVMRKLLFATEIDAIRVPKLMIEDLIGGMSYYEVLEKPYRYQVEIFYYTKPEYIPKDDPHWSCINIKNLDEHLARKDSRIKSKILDEEGKEIFSSEVE